MSIERSYHLPRTHVRFERPCKLVLFSLLLLLVCGCSSPATGPEPERDASSDGDSVEFTGSCESNEDCPESTYCREDRCYSDSLVFCDSDEKGIDQDGDGYGTGPARSSCKSECIARGESDCDRYLAPDCDDEDSSVYPGASEICDGQINDCYLRPGDPEEGEDCSDDG